MGQAHRPPKSHYGRKYNISQHALERFRERVDEEFISRSDQDLMNLLDERIQNAKRQEEVIDHHYRDTPSTVFVIESRKGERSLAVVRERTCVTVLDEKMLEINVREKTWTTAPINTPFKAALASVVVPSSKPKMIPLVVPPPKVRVCIDCKCPFEDPARPDHPMCGGCEFKRAAVIPPSDPIAAAGAAHAHALLMLAEASSRMLRLERELEDARANIETMKDNLARADHALRELVNNVANSNKEKQ